MTIWQALLLGLVQGVTEFLPVSSDGHLAIVQIFLELPNDIFFNVLLHLATLAAVLIFFWKDILNLRFKQLVWLAVGTIPAGLLGVAAGDWIEASANYLWIVALGFLVTGVANLVSQHLLKRDNQLDWPTLPKTILIGIAQATALMPGISRSGTTVATSLALGMNREAAFRFSFLLLIPATVGAVGLESFKLLQHSVPAPALVPTALGMVMAFGTGLASLRLLQLMIKRAQLGLFGYYCLVLGFGLLLVAVLSR